MEKNCCCVAEGSDTRPYCCDQYHDLLGSYLCIDQIAFGRLYSCPNPDGSLTSWVDPSLCNKPQKGGVYLKQGPSTGCSSWNDGNFPVLLSGEYCPGLYQCKQCRGDCSNCSVLYASGNAFFFLKEDSLKKNYFVGFSISMVGIILLTVGDGSTLDINFWGFPSFACNYDVGTLYGPDSFGCAQRVFQSSCHEGYVFLCAHHPGGGIAYRR